MRSKFPASTRTLQVLFFSALTIFIIATLSSSSHGEALKEKVRTSHVTKLWNWWKSGNSNGNGRGSGWMREHMERSERIYQTMVSQRHELDDEFKAAKARKELFPCNSHTRYFETPFTIWDYTTAAFNCPHSIQRIGRLGDGGKWICGLELLEAIPAPTAGDIQGRSPSPKIKTPAASSSERKCIIYSFGINTESSFEDALLQRTSACEIWGYDFSVDSFGPQLNVSAPYAHRAHFTKAGIAGESDVKKNPPFYSIQDIMEWNGHDHIDVLKMDIEGFEFDTMRSIISAFRMPAGTRKSKTEKEKNKKWDEVPGKKRQEEENDIGQRSGGGGVLDALEDDGLGEVPIAQVMIEIHLDPGRIKDTPTFMGWWQTLEEAGFRATWTEPNLLVSTLPLYDAKPRYSEYTFINIKDSKSLIFQGR